MNTFLFLRCFQWNMGISIGDILTFFGLCIAIYQFSKQMNASRELSMKTQKENWYLNIIVLPQLDLINDNYLNLITYILSKKKELDKFETELTQQKFKIECAKFKAEIKKNIDENFDHIIVLVRSYNSSLGNSVNNKILELQDICTTYVDKYDNEDNDKIRAYILQNKESLISILNKGLSTN